MGALAVVTFFCQYEALPDVLDISVILGWVMHAMYTRSFATFYFPKPKLCIPLSFLVIKNVNYLKLQAHKIILVVNQKKYLKWFLLFAYYKKCSHNIQKNPWKFSKLDRRP